MKTAPSYAGQVEGKGGEPYKIMLNTALSATSSFLANPLGFNQTRQFQIPFNRNVDFWCNGITQTLNRIIATRLDPTAFVFNASEGLFFNVWDARNLTRWFLPDPQPLNLAAGGAAARNAYGPAPFYVPHGQDITVEFINRAEGAAALNIDFQLIFHGVLAQKAGRA